jgi:HEAT repeat protein
MKNVDRARGAAFALAAALFWALPATGARGAEEHPYDDLMRRATRSPAKIALRADTAAAKDELFSHGADALRYFVERSDSDHYAFGAFARMLLPAVETNAAAEALLEIADGATGSVRRVAVFLLGQCRTPQHAARVRPFLDDTNTCGAAARTLGKWRDREAAAGIAILLRQPKEPRRAMAARALGEIGATNAVPALLEALDDPVFTVRRNASEALARIGGDATATQLLRALPDAGGRRARRIARTLGELGSPLARDELLRLLASDDPYLRGDAAFALRRLGENLDAWRQQNPAAAAHPFVRARLAEKP